MIHTISKTYSKLQERLERSPQGTPASEALFKILEILFTKEEAEYASVLPISFFTVETAASIWGKSKETARKILDSLSDKGILLDIKKGGNQVYVLAPPMAGFFEFSLMRTDGKFDSKVLSELYYQYINTENKFLTQVFALDPPILRVFIQEDMIQPEDESIVLGYERATHAIKTASFIAVSNCYCRRKMKNVGKGCNHPLDVCLTLNKTAESLAKHIHIREINKIEALEILDMCIKRGLVQMGSNEQEDVAWICNCCSCCCEALLAYKRLGYEPRISSNFVSEIIPEKCTGCGICVDRCPVDAIELCKEKADKFCAKVDSYRCIGCGVCARFCPTESEVIARRKITSFVPKDIFERFILEAIANGKLQNLIFDNYNLWTYDLLRRLFKIILSLEPAKRLLVNKQLQSKFIQALGKTYYLIDKDLFDGKKPDYSHPELK